MLDIVEMRAFARAKAQLDAAETDKDKPTGAMGQLVEQFRAEELRERLGPPR